MRVRTRAEFVRAEGEWGPEGIRGGGQGLAGRSPQPCSTPSGKGRGMCGLRATSTDGRVTQQVHGRQCQGGGSLGQCPPACQASAQLVEDGWSCHFARTIPAGRPCPKPWSSSAPCTPPPMCPFLLWGLNTEWPRSQEALLFRNLMDLVLWMGPARLPDKILRILPANA